MNTTFECGEELIEQANNTCSSLREAASNLKQLESEIQELIERLRWHVALGYDKHTAEFIKNLDITAERDMKE